MATLVSPGVSVTVTDQSIYASGQVSSVPLIFIATADEKMQQDGVSPALGTFEYGVVREITSIQQATQLYGNPVFLTDPAGNPKHGDTRNEYGLDAIMKALDVADRVYVVRANVNLDDDITNLKALWSKKVDNASLTLNSLIQTYIEEYNNQNGLLPTDTNYKETVTASELKTLVNEAMVDVFDSYSFNSQEFQNGFILDHSVAQAGYQDVLFNTTNGYLQLSDATTLASTSTYGAEIEIVDSGGTSIVSLSINGSNATTFGDLINELNTQLSGHAIATLGNGYLRITSSLTGLTSSVSILSDGTSGTSKLFANLSEYDGIDSSVQGTGATSLNTYDNTYTTITGSYDGLNSLIDNWTSGNTVPDEFTASEAESLLVAASIDYETTKEFKLYTSLGANDAARRAEIVKQLQAVINDPSTNIRSDRFDYNLVATPGYYETSDELVALAEAMRSEVFVVGETPFDKAPTGPNSIATWATSTQRVNNVLIGYWYGHGLSSNLDGSTIMTTAASTALRTILYSDSVENVWWAPAGTARGLCPHLTDIGYVSGTLGNATTFVSNHLDQGTRDSLYEFPKNINPITYIPGRGILVLGQKTSSPATNAEDRINVERLVCYIRRVLRRSLFPFLFEPDDKQTWDNAKYAADTFLSSLSARRGLYDWLVRCDSTTNTPDRIDRNEMWVEVAIQPTKDVEFIYIPISIENTGTDLSKVTQ